MLSNVLGFGFGYWILKRHREEKEAMLDLVETKPESLQAIPIKKGEAIFLYKPSQVIYFEAYDNYSYLYDLKGDKHLCDYSLKALETRLGDNFLRVHRSYVINRDHIQQITPFVKGRYVITFKDGNGTSITSSRSYAEEIKALIRL